MDQRSEFTDRAHFVAVASQAMRRILIDHARARSALKRGGDHTPVTLQTDMGARGGDRIDVLALDEALSRLASLDERQARLVELRFFGGLEIDEAAEALGMSRSTAVRDWRRARAFLARELEEADPSDPGPEPPPPDSSRSRT